MSDLGVIVTGVIVGSASGIGGALLGAWMNGRSQLSALKLTITAENERARNAEKRRIYARCMAACETATSALIVDRIAAERGTPEQKDAAFAALQEAYDAKAIAFAELDLIAPDSVVHAGDHLSEACDQFMLESSAQVDNRPLPEGPADERPTLGELSRYLYDAMREDLGEPPFTPAADPEPEPAPT